MAENIKTSSKKKNITKTGSKTKTNSKKTPSKVVKKNTTKKGDKTQVNKVAKTSSIKKSHESIEEVKTNKENNRIIEVTSQVSNDEPIITKVIDKEAVEKRLVAIKKEEKENSIIIGILLFIMIVLFVVGVIYIYDNTKNKSANKDYTQYSDKGNVSYKKNDTSSNNSSSNNTNNENNSVNEEKTPTYENIKTISIKDYENKLNNGEKMIVLVSRKGCGYCTLYEPTFNEVLGQLGYVAYKIDIATFTSKEEYELFESLFNIKGTPTTLVIDNKEIKNSISGNQAKETVIEWLKTNY